MDNVLTGTLVNPDKIYGKSAYEIALMHGFDGTEEEWLQSLVDQNMFVEASREAAGRAEAAAEAAEASKTEAQTADLSAGQSMISASNYATEAESAKTAAQKSESNARASEMVAKSMANQAGDYFRQTKELCDEFKPAAENLTKRVENLEAGLPTSAWQVDESVAYQKAVPANANPYAALTRIGGMTYNDNGTLRSSAVTSLTRTGKNLISFVGKTQATLEPVGTGQNNHVRNIEFDKYYIGVTANNYSSVSRGVTCEIKADNEVVVTSSSAGYGIGIPIKCKPNTTYYYSGIDNDATPRSFRIGMYTANGEFIRATENESAKSYAFTTTDNCYILMAVFTPTGSNVPTTYTNFQLEEGPKATEYKPYHEPITTELPAELLKLDGYGDGVSNEYNNHIDWRPTDGVKKFIQMCAERAYQSGDESLVNVVTDGSNKTVYVLDTPIETDISHVLSDDNIIAVEGGGMLTFDNEHQQAVPSTITYQLNTNA